MHSLWRGSALQKARLLSGLVLFAFAATHFFNHALGLVSLDAMNAFDHWRFLVIRSRPGTIVLAAALAVHVVLALGKLVQRRSLHMPFWEVLQIALGLAIPPFLLPHIVNTRVASTLFGVSDTYTYQLARIWPNAIAPQTILMLLVWIHGCMGLHYWLRLSHTYVRIAPALFALAVLLPFAAFAGVSVQGRTIEARLAEPKLFETLKDETNWPSDAVDDRLATIRKQTLSAFVGGLGALALAIALRTTLRRRRHGASVTYLAGPTIRAQPGESLLDVSRRAGISHLSVCGGRGRCSTCRVMVVDGEGSFEPPSAIEAATLRAIDAGPQVRLACQARPKADVTITPLLKADRGAAFLPEPRVGTPEAIERELAVLFVDMRGFTTLTEQKLAFDVVFILNQFFTAVGKPIYDQGGWIANYAGDGLIALFADPGGVGGACRSALLAVSAIDIEVAALSELLKREVRQPIGVAMGLHVGPHVIGRIGYRDAQSQGVIGLAINVASRMEALAKEHGVQIALSRTAAEHAGLETTGLRVEETQVRGLVEPIGVVFVPEARTLRGRLSAGPAEPPGRSLAKTPA